MVCDANRLIMHVDATWPGSANDAHVMRESAISEMGDDGEVGRFFLLGDSG